MIEHLVIELNWHERDAVHAMVHHCYLSQRQTDVVLAQLMDLRVACTSMSGENQVNKHQCQMLCLPPQFGVVGHEVIGEVASSLVHLFALCTFDGQV